MSARPSLADAVSAFGAAAKATLSSPAITGEPEEQLRTPLVALCKAVASVAGVAAHDIELVGETALSDLMIRPDFAVTRKKALIGFIEVKAPGKGADPSRFKDKHDRAQWEKLKALPNLTLHRRQCLQPVARRQARLAHCQAGGRCRDLRQGAGLSA